MTKAGLQDDLDAHGLQPDRLWLHRLHRQYRTRCRSPSPKAIHDGDLVAAAVLSGNRNFEGRVHAEVKANYLASPPLVVAYAIAGTMNIDLTTEPLGQDSDGRDVFLRDIWPSSAEIADDRALDCDARHVRRALCRRLQGRRKWQALGKARASLTYGWNTVSTYVQNPPYFEGITMEPKPVTDVINARILGLFGDSITTDHISPAGCDQA